MSIVTFYSSNGDEVQVKSNNVTYLYDFSCNGEDKHSSLVSCQKHAKHILLDTLTWNNATIVPVDINTNQSLIADKFTDFNLCSNYDRVVIHKPEGYTLDITDTSDCVAICEATFDELKAKYYPEGITSYRTAHYKTTSGETLSTQVAVETITLDSIAWDGFKWIEGN